MSAAKKAPPNKQTAKRRLFGDDDEHQDVSVPSIIPTTVSSPPVSVLETPQKKQRLEDGIQSFFSPKSIAIVTPEKEEEVATPVKSTPVKPKEDVGQGYVPTYIHKNLSYQRKGGASLGEKLRKAFELVENHFTIPSDFEQDRSYGPLSGTCFEERAIRAYNLSLLEPKEEKDATLGICSNCATLGHKRNDCPDLI
jgi:hypothetical protein